MAPRISQAEVKSKGQKHEVLMPLLSAMFSEFQEAARKRPDAVLSQKRVEIVNRLLVDIYAVLESEPSMAYLELLDSEDASSEYRCKAYAGSSLGRDGGV